VPQSTNKKAAATRRNTPAKNRAAKRAPAPTAPVKPKGNAQPVTRIVVASSTKQDKKYKKAKVVRDSFTMPEGDYARIAELKRTCLAGGVSVKKSELLRAGLLALAALAPANLLAAIGTLENVKTGRPVKDPDLREKHPKPRKHK
jgi:hypothetical protein